MNQKILDHYNEGLRVYRLLLNDLPKIEEISKFLVKTIKKKKIIFLFMETEAPSLIALTLSVN